MTIDPNTALNLLTIDPTGAVFDGAGWIAKYREAALRQHALFFDAWVKGDHERALVELHFLLTSVCGVLRNMKLIGTVLGKDINTYVNGQNYEDYWDARHHFEHIEDRVHGSRRNAPQPVFDGANSRTIHFGLDGSRQVFRFGAKSIDVSDGFLDEFIGFVDGLEPLLMSRTSQ